MFKKLVAIGLMAFLLTISIAPVYACEDTSPVNTGKTDSSKGNFKDVGKDHWAYQSINIMTKNGILTGYGDGTFKPDNVVTRGEFAKMMVMALKIDINKNVSSSFEDIKNRDWTASYVEAAKKYLTGFRESDGDYFMPSDPAVREDMAVALVKALKYDADEPNLGILDSFSDSSSISPNLQKYVAIAVAHEIMSGYDSDSGKTFKPQNSLTRAEASVLLCRVVQSEKITYDDQKVTYDDGSTAPDTTETTTPDTTETTTPDTTTPESNYSAATVSAQNTNDGVRATWTRPFGTNISGYKVVLSKSNSNPSYPDDGYLYWITNLDQISAVIKAGLDYQGGDIRGTLESGETYYLSITVLYNDGTKKPGNVISITLP